MTWTVDSTNRRERDYPDGCYGHVSNGTKIAIWSLWGPGDESSEIATGHERSQEAAQVACDQAHARRRA